MFLDKYGTISDTEFFNSLHLKHYSNTDWLTVLDMVKYNGVTFIIFFTF